MHNRLYWYNIFRFIKKRNIMAHKGKPSGIDKKIGRSPAAISTMPDEEENREYEYTGKQKIVASQVRSGKPNRNTNKQKATNAHGYKN